MNSDYGYYNNNNNLSMNDRAVETFEILEQLAVEQRLSIHPVSNQLFKQK